MSAESRRPSSAERGPVDFNRNYIERRDFPASWRGYDPDAVDRHLREVADTVEELQDLLTELQRPQRPEPQSLAGVAAEQVRLIIEAAEGSASGIEERASQRAATIGERADVEIEGRIARVEEGSDDLLRRADAFEGELASIVETHRVAGDLLAQLMGQALRGEIESMRGVLEGLRGSGTADDAETIEAPDTGEHDRQRLDETQSFGLPGDLRPDAAGAHEVEPALDPEPEEELGTGGDIGGREAAPRWPSAEGESWDGAERADDLDVEPPEPRGAEEEIAPTATPGEELPPGALAGGEPGESFDEEVEPADAPGRSAGGGKDEGARLVALNMALNGAPREETDRYLAENFELADRQAVLDDVYARAG